MTMVVKPSTCYFPLVDVSAAVGAGYLYIGEPDTDPEVGANQKTVTAVKEDGTTVAMSQPITLSAGGVPLYSGSPVTLTVDGSYSMKVLNIYGSQIYYIPSIDDYEVQGVKFLHNYADLAAAITDISTTETLLVIDEDVTMDEHVTIPSTLTLRFISGKVISGPYTLTVNGPIEAGNYQIFGTDTFVKLGDAVDNASIRWFGATGDGSTDDTTAIQNAINAVSWGANKLSASAGIYQYSTLYFHYDAGDNPNYKTPSGVLSRTSLVIDGAGAMHDSTFRYATYTSTSSLDLPGTVFRSTATTANGLEIGVGVPHVDRADAGNIKLRNIAFLGETTGRIVNVAYAQVGFVMEDCLVGMKADVATVGVHINNAWGSMLRNVWVRSQTDNDDVETGAASIGLQIDVYDEGVVDYLAGGNFYLNTVSVANCKTGYDFVANNVTMINCQDSRCDIGFYIHGVNVALIDNHYSEYSYSSIMNVTNAYGLTVSGGVFNLEETDTYGIQLGTAGGAGNARNITFDGCRIRHIGNNGAAAFRIYNDTEGVNIKNIWAQMDADPFMYIAGAPDTGDLVNIGHIVYSSESGAGWTYDPTSIIYNNGTTSDFRFACNFGPDSRRGTASGVYDFDDQGGTIAAHVIGQIPDNATITKAHYEVITPLTSGGASVIRVGVAATDTQGIIADTAFDNAVFNAGYHDALPDNTAANFTTKTTAGKDVVFTIQDAALTAGKIYFYWEWAVSE